jgi:hypothetical protein
MVCHQPIWVIHGLARLEKRYVLTSNERQHFAGLFANSQPLSVPVRDQNAICNPFNLNVGQDA